MMLRRRWKWLLLGAAIPLLLWGCDRVFMVHWVGGTDLEVEFVVSEAGTGTPVAGASVEVQSEGGLYAEDYKQAFALVADSEGRASKICKDSMCFGTQSGLTITDTYAVHLPWWRFRVVAPDYEPTSWTELDVPDYIRATRREGPRRAKLVVPVSLTRNKR